MATICPKCHKIELHSDDSEGFVCYECGTAFLLEEEGWIEEGGNEMRNDENPYFISTGKAGVKNDS